MNPTFMSKMRTIAIGVAFVGGTLWGLKLAHRSREEVANSKRRQLREELVALREEEKMLDEWERQRKLDEETQKR